MSTASTPDYSNLSDERIERINKIGQKLKTSDSGVQRKDYHYKYYIKNREKIYENRKKKMTCIECNKEYSLETWQGHKRTKKHQMMAELYNLKNNN